MLGDEAVGNGEPLKVVEQGSDFNKITLRLSKHWRQRTQWTQGFLNLRPRLGGAMNDVPCPDLSI